MGKVTFGFIVRNRLIKQGLWDAVLFNAPTRTERANVLVHAAQDDVSDALRPYLIEREENSWAVLRHVWFGLFRAFLQDAAATKLVILSGACVPLAGFDSICDAVLASEGSILTRHGYLDKQRYGLVARKTHPLLRKGYKLAESWVVFDRAAIELFVANERTIKDWFKECIYDTEVIPATLLNHFKLPYELTRLWWIEWQPMAKHPNLLNLSEKNIAKAVASGALFARKVDESTDTSALETALGL